MGSRPGSFFVREYDDRQNFGPLKDRSHARMVASNFTARGTAQFGAPSEVYGEALDNRCGEIVVGKLEQNMDVSAAIKALASRSPKGTSVVLL